MDDGKQVLNHFLPWRRRFLIDHHDLASVLERKMVEQVESEANKPSHRPRVANAVFALTRIAPFARQLMDSSFVEYVCSGTKPTQNSFGDPRWEAGWNIVLDCLEELRGSALQLPL